MSSAPSVLAVDLDGTLLRSDMLFESFWSAFGRDWRLPVRAGRALLQGRAALKSMLAGEQSIDLTTLPYNSEVIDYIKDWRAKGGTAVLVTATDQTLADQIAAHLDVFDDVYGSNGQTNLKGTAKADFLRERYGSGGYAYMGDTTADLVVWKDAQTAIAVNAPPAVTRQLHSMDAAAEHLTGQPYKRSGYLKAIRPHQWLKNLLVFLPMLTAHQLDLATFLQSLVAFFVFSLVASGVYVLNDLLDLKSDRAHARKCARPFAAGDIPITHASYMLAGLFLGGLVLSLFLPPAFLLVMVIYFGLTTLYSISLKRKVIVDICTLAGLYTIRIVAGGAATGIPLSLWLLAFSIFFFFSLASVKRQAELIDNVASGKIAPAGRGYIVDDLPVVVMMGIASGYVSVLVMALYIQSPSVAALYSTPLMLSGVCCILLYWLSRVMIITHRGHMNDDPVVFAARDRISQVCVVLIALIAIGGALL